MDKENKYYSLIEGLVKQHRKFQGYEAILDDIIDDVFKHSEIVIKSVDNELVIKAYLEKVVSTSVITVPKRLNIKSSYNNIRTIDTVAAVPVTEKEQPQVQDVVVPEKSFVSEQTEQSEPFAEENNIENVDKSLSAVLEEEAHDDEEEELLLPENQDLSSDSQSEPENMQFQEYGSAENDENYILEEPVFEENSDSEVVEKANPEYVDKMINSIETSSVFTQESELSERSVVDNDSEELTLDMIQNDFKEAEEDIQVSDSEDTLQDEPEQKEPEQEENTISYSALSEVENLDDVSVLEPEEDIGELLSQEELYNKELNEDDLNTEESEITVAEEYTDINPGVETNAEEELVTEDSFTEENSENIEEFENAAEMIAETEEEKQENPAAENENELTETVALETEEVQSENESELQENPAAENENELTETAALETEEIQSENESELQENTAEDFNNSEDAADFSGEMEELAVVDVDEQEEQTEPVIDTEIEILDTYETDDNPDVSEDKFDENIEELNITDIEEAEPEEKNNEASADFELDNIDFDEEELSPFETDDSNIDNSDISFDFELTQYSADNKDEPSNAENTELYEPAEPDIPQISDEDENFNSFDDLITFDEPNILTEENEEVHLPENNLVLNNEDSDDNESISFLEEDSENDVFLEEEKDDDVTEEVYQFKPMDYSAFNYMPTVNNTEEADTGSLSDKIIMLNNIKPELNVLKIFDLKYKKNLSIDKIAEELNTEKQSVIDALNEIVNLT